MTLESVKVATAAYDLKWYGGDRDAKMSLLLIMLRAQRPCVFTAAKFTDVSLVTFMTVCYVCTVIRSDQFENRIFVADCQIGVLVLHVLAKGERGRTN